MKQTILYWSHTEDFRIKLTLFDGFFQTFYRLKKSKMLVIYCVSMIKKQHATPRGRNEKERKVNLVY